MLIDKQKKTHLFYCECCQFTCNNKTHYSRHLLTAKHFRLNNTNENNNNFTPEKVSIVEYNCNCGKTYKHLSSLTKHKKMCNKIVNKKSCVLTEISNDLILQLVKENKELKEILIEQNKKTEKQMNTIIELTKNNKTININSNSNSSTFNLNFFLNETCKNAMNITDFVNSIKLQLTDLENVGRQGFVDGISNIIVKNLKALDQSIRPLHCTDKKRETLYIKDENKWEKEDITCQKVRNAINTIAKKNSKLLIDYKYKYPDCLDSNSRNSDKYTKLIIEAYGGKNNENNENEHKIIKNIAKEVVINKA